ncbi:MAG: sn-glycerol-3-phosphate import ATP-binding protein UgpC [Azospirillum sp.]|nr:sn-glycerol-3-phosphate import ATP-binding protein UgpC [Azospirillum sp.]
MAQVELRAIKKSFGDVAVIHGVDCPIADGEFVVILGPSGCGKSTLLRIVAGLETQSSGDVVIGGKVVNTVEPKDRNIAMVFQNYALYPHMSVRENMAYGLKVRGLPKPEIEAAVARAAKILELEKLLDRRPRQLSGGQRQRVAMGRAIVRNPEVFLFDEPLSNLDAKLRVQMRIELKQLHSQLKTTSIYVTHDQVEAMTLADRLIVMNGGRAEHIGAPLDVYARPATTFVAGFIGAPAMNLVPGTLVAGGVAIDGTKLGVAHPAKTVTGADVTVGFRPETLHLDPAGPVALLVTLVGALGADTLVHGRMGGPQGPTITARLPGVVKVREGERMVLRVAPEDIHLFDRATGRRID